MVMKALGQDDFPDWDSFQSALREKMRPVEALGLVPGPEANWRMEKDAAEKEKQAEERIRHAPRMEEVCRINDRMLIQESMERLLREIQRPRPFALRVMDFAWPDLEAFSGTAPEEGNDGAAEAARQLRTAVENNWYGPWNPLPHDVFVDTMTCESWLLSPVLKDLLPPASRILRFQRAFDLTPGTEDEREAVLQWVFRLTAPQQKNVSLDALPENTSLQKSMKRFLLSGGVFTAASGPLVRPFAG